MRILLVRSRSTGGIGVHVAALATGLRENGHHVAVLEAAGRRAWPDIRRAARGMDVVHAHGLRAGAAACIAVPGSARLVVTLHNPAPPGPAGELLERVVARRADVVLGASEDLVARARALDARDARFGPVAAVLGPATRSRADMRAELGVADGETLVLAVGRLAPQKDYPTLLAAALRATKDRADGGRARATTSTAPAPATSGASALTFVIAGDGPLRADLQAHIDAGHLPVTLLGHRTDIPDLLSAADVFVMCSTWEARPLALQEAMQAGLPCVATEVGGIPDLVGPAATLVRPGDPDALLAAVVSAAARPAPVPAVQTATWPGPAEELAAVLAAYAR